MKLSDRLRKSAGQILENPGCWPFRPYPFTDWLKTVALWREFGAMPEQHDPEHECMWLLLMAEIQEDRE